MDSSSAIAASKSLIDVSRHSVFDTLAAISPRLNVTRTVSPGATSAAARIDPRPIGVPAHGVAAAEHGQRAERVEPAGGVAQLRLGAMLASPDRGRRAGRRAPTSRVRMPASRRPRSNVASCRSSCTRRRSRAATAARAIAAPARATAPRRAGRASRAVRGIRQTPGARRSRARGGSAPERDCGRGRAQASCSRSIRPKNSSFAGDHDFRGRRRRRRAQVGDEVGDGDVGFVADRGDHRHRRPRRSPARRLLR